MDLNICLYCEKRLSEDNINFCSLACEAHEASKSSSYATFPSSYQHQVFPSSSFNYNSNRSSLYNNTNDSTTTTTTMITTTPVLSYHRRRSLYYPKDQPRRSSFSSSSSLSSLTSTSSSTTNSLFASNHHYYTSRPTTMDNTSMHSYESSTDMDYNVHTSYL